MPSSVNQLIGRQFAIAHGDAAPLDVPKFDKYTICNLRGGIGKTSLVFSLSYLSDNILCVDTCPQCNLTSFFDDNYTQNISTTVYDIILSHIIPGLGKSTRVAKKISATNKYFEGKNSFFLPSDTKLYLLPTQFATALSQVNTISGGKEVAIKDGLLYSLRDEIVREMSETNTNRCLIDTSPFFSGATHLAWHACDALIVPVRTDPQSVNSLSLLIDILSNPASEFRKVLPSDNHTPKIQIVVLTHCGWSTVAGSRNVPNQQTKMYVERVYDIISRNITHFTTDNPENHLLLLDDFLGTGRISSARSKPIPLLSPGESATINRVRTEVNASVDKIKKQLEYIHNSLW